MKRISLLIIYFCFVLISVFSAYDRAMVVNRISEAINTQDNLVFSLLVYDGAANVNMRTENYPARNDGGSLTWASSNSSSQDYIPMESITNTSNTDRYRDDHMIAMGGIEISSDYDKWYMTDAGWQWQDGRFEYHDCYIIERDLTDIEGFSLDLSVDSSSDFEFISQSDNSYRRPFELYYVPKSTYTGTDSRGTAYKIDRSISRTLPYDPQANGSVVRPGIWFDMIVALPYDEYNDVGVVANDTLYPLQDASDYTSMVTITITCNGTLKYNVYYADEYRQSTWGGAGTGDLTFIETIEYPLNGFTETITIPFYGYSTSFDTPPTDSVGSLYISTTPESQNINLNPGATPGRVKVADISYLLNDGRHADTSSFADYDPSFAWIFLSASPDATVPNDNGFRLINDEAGDILTTSNNVPYIVEVQGINKSTGNTAGIGAGSIVEFDGTAARSSFPDVLPEGAATGANFIHTVCEYGRNLPHVDNAYYHYHSFEGEVYIQLRPNSTTEPPMAGRYTSDIYVHVLSGE